MERTLLPTLRLSLEMTETLTEIERNGLKINLTTLTEIETEFQAELEELEIRLNDMAREAMGDTPINLASPDDRSILLYSRRVVDKKEWSRVFNLGHEMRGATMKPKQRVRMKKTVFASTVRRMTEVVRKTVGSRCAGCIGFGRVRPVNKNGEPSKALRICKPCNGAGVIYTPTREVAGFKVVPRDPYDTAAAGFKTDKTTLEDRAIELSGDAKEFATAYIRYNALRTYLNTFVEGMKTMLMRMVSSIQSLCSVLRRRVVFRAAILTFRICHVEIPSLYGRLSRVAFRVGLYLRGITRN